MSSLFYNRNGSSQNLAGNSPSATPVINMGSSNRFTPSSTRTPPSTPSRSPALTGHPPSKQPLRRQGPSLSSASLPTSAASESSSTSSQVSSSIPRLIVEDADIPPSNCYRLVVLGSARVGKTSLVGRFLGCSRFNEAYTPTIEDFHRKFYRIRGETYRLDILDTSGNDPFPAMRRLSLLTGFVILMLKVD